MIAIESHKRSIAKAVSWRIFASLVTMLTVFVFTRELVLSAGIGIVDAVIKIIGYYGHERLWHKIRFGIKETREDYQI